MATEMPRRSRQLGRSGREAVHLHPIAREPVEIGTYDQRYRATPRRIQAPHQDTDRVAFRRDGSNAVLVITRFRPDHHAKSRWLADAPRELFPQCIDWQPDPITSSPG